MCEVIAASGASQFLVILELARFAGIEMSESMKTVYVLRLRLDDESPWGEPEYFRNRRERDRAASFNRIIGGIKTYSYQEKKTPEEIAELCDQ